MDILTIGCSMDLFELSDRNSDYLGQMYNSLEKRCKENNNLEKLNMFASAVKNTWTVAINMKNRALISFLISGNYKNVYELKKNDEKILIQEIKLDISAEKAAKLRLKEFSRPRFTFDGTFNNGDRFKYGALNLKGNGIQKYGEYCVVFKREHLEKFFTLAFIKEDSLNYVCDDKINFQRFSQDISNRKDIHKLASIKHENDLDTDNEKLTLKICSENCYIEAVTADDILKQHIGCIRISKKKYSLYFDNLYKDFKSELSDPEERCNVENFKNIIELLNQQHINLEVIEDHEN